MKKWTIYLTLCGFLALQETYSMQSGAASKFKAFFKPDNLKALFENYNNFMQKIERPLKAHHNNSQTIVLPGDETSENEPFLDKIKQDFTVEKLKNLTFDEFVLLIIAYKFQNNRSTFSYSASVPSTVAPRRVSIPSMESNKKPVEVLKPIKPSFNSTLGITGLTPLS